MPGSANSARRRAASRETSVNRRVSPLVRTWRALLGGGSANRRKGTWQSMPPTSMWAPCEVNETTVPSKVLPTGESLTNLRNVNASLRASPAVCVGATAGGPALVDLVALAALVDLVALAALVAFAALVAGSVPAVLVALAALVDLVGFAVFMALVALV